MGLTAQLGVRIQGRYVRVVWVASTLAPPPCHLSPSPPASIPSPSESRHLEEEGLQLVSGEEERKEDKRRGEKGGSLPPPSQENKGGSLPPPPQESKGGSLPPPPQESKGCSLPPPPQESQGCSPPPSPQESQGGIPPPPPQESQGCSPPPPPQESKEGGLVQFNKCVAWEECLDCYRVTCACSVERGEALIPILVSIWDLDSIAPAEVLQERNDPSLLPAAAHEPKKKRPDLHTWAQETLPAHAAYGSSRKRVKFE